MTTITFTVTPVDTKEQPFTKTITHDEMEVLENFMYLIKHNKSWVISDIAFTTEELAQANSFL